MKKKIFVMATIVILAVVTLWGVNLKTPNTLSMFLRNVEAVALPGDESGTGGVDYTKNHINDPQNCLVTETRKCTIAITIPKFGVLCTINFDYDVEVQGTQNYCLYTGGPSGCSFRECKKN